MVRAIMLAHTILVVITGALDAQPRNSPIGRAITREAGAGWENSVTRLDEERQVPVVGSRVRITAPEMGLYRVAGSVTEVATNGSILLNPDRGRPPIWVESSHISELDVSIGRKTNVLKGMGIGLLIGGGTGVAMGMLSDGDDWFSRGELIVMGGIVLGVPAALVGGIVGYMHLTDSWAEGFVQTTGLNLYPEIGVGGVGVGLRLMAGGVER